MHEPFDGVFAVAIPDNMKVCSEPSASSASGRWSCS